MQLINGDCLEEMKNIPGGSVDMVLTDPPYGTTACKWDSIIPLEPMWEQLKRVIKPNGAIVMTASQPFTTTLIASNMKMFKYEWAWDKVNKYTNYLNAKHQPMRRHENICVFAKKKTTFNQQRREGGYISRQSRVPNPEVYGKTTKRSYGETVSSLSPHSVLQIPAHDPNNQFHPTQKPVALMEYLIKTYTNEGETVLDFTMGSGTTGVACKNLNRDFIGIELDKEYFEIAKNRISST